MRILVLQHVNVEHPGVFRDFWSAAGDEWHAVELDAGDPIPPLEHFDLMVVMGGPMDVWQEDRHPWLVREKAAIRRWVEQLDRPFLGVCLGHQLLAEALGGKVQLMSRPEVGLAPVNVTAQGRADPLFEGFDAKIETFQWHGAEIAQLPQGAVTLASNPACGVQAFRWGTHAYGVQYHVEITETTVEDWQRLPEYAASLQQALGTERAARLDGEVRPRLRAFRASAQRLNDNLRRVIRAAMPHTAVCR